MMVKVVVAIAMVMTNRVFFLLFFFSLLPFLSFLYFFLLFAFFPRCSLVMVTLSLETPPTVTLSLRCQGDVELTNEVGGFE